MCEGGFRRAACGAPVATVDAVFLRYASFAREDLPSVLIWLRVGTNGAVMSCRLLRWVQWELTLLYEGFFFERECSVRLVNLTDF